MTKKLITAAILCLTFSAPAFAESWTGLVTDAMCSKKHKAGNAEDTECAKKCVAGGEAAVLVVDGKVYKIDNQTAVKDHIGHTVTVSGKLTGDTIHIDAVKS
jgi:hypothetical protein